MTHWWENEETSVSKKTDNITKPWKFQVEAKTLPGEKLCVTGNCDELGHWTIDNALVLSQENENVWSCVTNISADIDVRYRYFVCIPIEKQGQPKLIVRRWETGINPRTISVQAPSNTNGQNACDTEVFGQYNNITAIEKGWLTCETAVQLKLVNNPMRIWKNKLKNSKISIKLTAVSLSRPNGELEDEGYSLETTELLKNSTLWPLTEIAVMNEEEREFRVQNQFGRVYTDNEFVVFQTLTHNFESTAYLLDFYADDRSSTSTDPPSHLGSCHVLPSVLTQGMGSFILPITNTVQRRPIGEITVEYLVVTPLEQQSDMKITLSSQWRDSWHGLDVGHRGAGVSFGCGIQCAAVRENTIASLRSAGEAGADLVEFDVQLSKDLVPVVYHDFYVALSIQRKLASNGTGDKINLNGNGGTSCSGSDENVSSNSDCGEKDLTLNDVIKVPVKELTFDEMESMKVYHVKEGQAKLKRRFSRDCEADHQAFPSLQRVFQRIDLSVGFNVELKWTMLRADGSYELEHPVEMNTFVDKILEVVLDNAGDRNVVFSCFHPDIVTMLRLKQNKYPVIFLTQGVTAKWPQYRDPRCHNVTMGTHHAVSASLLGLSVHAEDLLRDDTQVRYIIDAGLQVWCWGTDANDVGNVKRLKQLGLQAVINDRVVEHSAKNESVFLIEAREAAKLLTRLK